MPDLQVQDEALTLFLGGHETAAKALTWTLYLLMTHPEVYERHRQEVDQALQGRPPTAEDMPRLGYTLQVFKESMRLYPPGSGLIRRAVRDVEVGGYHVPEGQHVGVFIYALHRRPEVFPEPERFDPERFAPERERKLPQCAYMPFGAGPRVCIGNHFALLQGPLVLAALTQRVTFSLVPDQQIVPDFKLTLRPKYGLRAVAHRRA
jgi:cytochrome P450